MINFTTDKVVIVNYPGQASGKFLINCLGLANNALFQDSYLAEEQLAGRLTQTDKLNILLRRINETTGEWSDLYLGCTQFFGPKFLTYTPGSENTSMFNKIVESIPDSYYFFVVAHDDSELLVRKQIWPNSRVIKFYNYQQFLKLRKAGGWNNIHTITVTGPFNGAPLSDSDLSWNVSNYFNRETLVSEIENLYRYLNLSGFNKEAIEKYYNSWIAALKRLASA